MGEGYIVRRGGSSIGNKSTIFVTAPSGTNKVTAKYGGQTKTAKFKDKYWVLSDLDYGPNVSWSITATDGRQSKTVNQSMTRLDIVYITITYYDGRLYLNGDQCVKYSGGWASTVPVDWDGTDRRVSMTAESSCLSIKGTNVLSAGFISTKNKINLSEYSKITMVVSDIYSWNNNNRDALVVTDRIGSLFTPGGGGDSLLPGTITYKNINPGAGKQTITLDISKVSSGYVGLRVTAPQNSYSVCAKIYSVHLVR